MTKADKYLVRDINNILENGLWISILDLNTQMGLLHTHVL